MENHKQRAIKIQFILIKNHRSLIAFHLIVFKKYSQCAMHMTKLIIKINERDEEKKQIESAEEAKPHRIRDIRTYK